MHPQRQYNLQRQIDRQIMSDNSESNNSNLDLLTNSTFNKNAIKDQKNASLAQMKEIQSEIDKLFKKLGSMSNNSMSSMTLFEQLLQISPLFRQFSSYLINLSDETQYQLYIKFRNLFKVFKDDVTSKIGLDSIQALENEEKMKEIKDTLKYVAENLKSLYNHVHEQSQRYVIWVDLNNNLENKHALQEIQLKYQPSIVVQFYSDVEKFKCEFKNYYNQPVFLILSGQVANDYSPEDKQLFKWIKQEIAQHKQEIRIRNIIIYAGSIFVIYNKSKFEKDESKLVKLVTDNTDQMLKALDQLISPNQFCRVIDFQDLQFIFQDSFKKKLITMYITPINKTLLEYKPQSINLKQIFDEVQQIIDEKQIHFFESDLKLHFFLSKISKIYEENQDNEQHIAQGLLKLYTEDMGEDISFYKIINTTLNTLNESLISKMMPLIEMLSKALQVYDDSLEQQSIKQGIPKELYRGSSIPLENYKDFVDTNKLICLPSFSSFTNDFFIAKTFMEENAFPDCQQCIFIYEHKSGSVQYQFRPKYISQISASIRNESEYLTQPFVTYKIVKIEKCDLFYKIYLALN